MNEIDNPMIKTPAAPDYHESPFLPCRGTAPSFREWILEEWLPEDIIGDPQVFEVLITKYFKDYEQWLKEI